MITREMIRNGRPTSVGSLVCTQKIVDDGISTLFYHTAIHMCREDFIGGKNDERDFQQLTKFFSLLRDRLSSVFNFREASYVDDYGVFTFSAQDGWLCLADLPLPLDPALAQDVFMGMLTILDEYRQCDINNNGYRPLLFICRESVYVQLDETGRLAAIRLLPLPYNKRILYAGMPHEVFHKKADISTDIYMAAYLYLSLRFTEEQSFDESEFSLCDCLAERCLSPFTMRRPSLEQLMETFGEESNQKDAETPTNAVPAVNKACESIRYDYNDVEPQKRAKKRGLKRLESLFSTEAADAEDE